LTWNPAAKRFLILVKIEIVIDKSCRAAFPGHGMVNRQVNFAVEENGKLFEQKCHIIAAICC